MQALIVNGMLAPGKKGLALVGAENPYLAYLQNMVALSWLRICHRKLPEKKVRLIIFSIHRLWMSYTPLPTDIFLAQILITRLSFKI